MRFTMQALSCTAKTNKPPQMTPHGTVHVAMLLKHSTEAPGPAESLCWSPQRRLPMTLTCISICAFSIAVLVNNAACCLMARDLVSSSALAAVCAGALLARPGQHQCSHVCHQPADGPPVQRGSHPPHQERARPGGTHSQEFHPFAQKHGT